MGYTMNGLVKEFWPDNDDKTMYLTGEYSLSCILELIKEKWGEDVDMDKIHINSEYIQTNALGYDRYDPSDYTEFTVISKS